MPFHGYSMSVTSGFLDGDAAPKSLCLLAAAAAAERLKAQFFIDRSNWKTLLVDQNSSQLRFDTLIQELSLSDDNLRCLVRLFHFAPITRLDLRSSCVTVDGLRDYLRDPVRANAIRELSLPSKFTVCGTPACSSSLGNALIPKLLKLNIGSHIELLRSLSMWNPNLYNLVARGIDTEQNVELECHLFSLIAGDTASSLRYLDVSHWRFQHLHFLTTFRQLTKLILHGVPQNDTTELVHLTQLRYLDLSQSKRDYGIFENPEKQLKVLAVATNLVELTHIDISGTNLAHYNLTTFDPEFNNDGRTVETDVPGLTGLKKPLQFLGLFDCGGADHLRRLPAATVAGTATPEQILVALHYHKARPAMLENLLVQLTCFRDFTLDQGDAIFRSSCVAHLTTQLAEFQKMDITQLLLLSLFFLLPEGDSEIEVFGPAGLRARVAETVAKTLILSGTNDKSWTLLIVIRLFKYLPLSLYLPLGTHLLRNSKGRVDESMFFPTWSLLSALGKHCTQAQKEMLGSEGLIDICLRAVVFSASFHRDKELPILWATMSSFMKGCPQNCARFLDYDGIDAFLDCVALVATIRHACLHANTNAERDPHSCGISE